MLTGGGVISDDSAAVSGIAIRHKTKRLDGPGFRVAKALIEQSQGGKSASRVGKVVSADRSAVLHADETGWRMDGKTHWLWCFTNDHTTFYMVDRSRGSPALKRFFKEAFDGILVTDFGGSRHFVLGGLRRDRVRRTTVLPRASASRIGKDEPSQSVGGMEGVF